VKLNSRAAAALLSSAADCDGCAVLLLGSSITRARHLILLASPVLSVTD